MREQVVVGEEIPGPYAISRVIGHFAIGAGFFYPYGIAFDPVENALYGVSRSFPQVSKWSPDGDHLLSFGQSEPGTNGLPSAESGGLYWPAAVTVAEGRVYVSDEAHRFVRIFGTDGTELDTWHASPETFDRPAGLAVLPNGDVLVVDALNDRVRVLSGDGAPRGTWGDHATMPGTLSLPWGVAVDGERECVYLTDWRKDRIVRLDFDGGCRGVLGESGDGPGQLRRPAGVAVDGDGNVAVADWGNDRVQVLTPRGAVVAVLQGEGHHLSKVAQQYLETKVEVAEMRRKAGAPHRLERYFYAPSDVAFDAAGTLYCADTLRHRVQVFGRQS